MAYYKNADLPLAQAAIDRFMRLNPTHPNIDYVIYVRGLTNMALDDSALQGFFGVDRSDRDPQHARDAFNDFSNWCVVIRTASTPLTPINAWWCS